MIEHLYQVRVLEERKELDTRVDALESFTHSVAFRALPASEKALLEYQLEAMRRYSEILGERIALWSAHDRPKTS